MSKSLELSEVCVDFGTQFDACLFETIEQIFVCAFAAEEIPKFVGYF